VQTHIKIDPDTNTVSTRALWVTENLPAETLMYAPVYASRSRAPGAKKTADNILQSFVGYGITRVQLGGDNTTGQGIVAIRMGGV
jgi:CRISPR-associated protein Cmr4